MSTDSNSSSTQVIQAGGSFGGTSTSQFKDQDYGSEALGSAKNLKRFFAQLNPLVSQLKNISGGGGIGLSNLDADLISIPLSAFQSDWAGVSAAGLVTGGSTILAFDGTNNRISVRKDPFGMVTLAFSVVTAAGGTITGTTAIPQEFRPVADCSFSIGGTVQSITISASTGAITLSGAISMSGIINYATYPAANSSPGTNPAFPVYLKIAKGRIPVACILAGAKPQVSGDQFKTNTGSLGLPIGCAWTFLGAQTPAADGSQINQIRIDSVPGLVAKTQYVLNFLVYYGDTGSGSGS